MRLYSPKLFFKDPWVLLPTVLSIVCLVVVTVYQFLAVPSGETTYFLHTTIVFGVDLVGSYGSLFVPILVGLGICLVNEVLAFFLYGTERFLSRALLFFMAAAEVGLAVSVYLIVKLNV